MKRSMMLALELLVVLVAAIPMLAHHGVAAYDETHPITMKGIVTKLDWVNPHTQIYFDVQDEKSGVVHWVCETVAPGKLTKAGWSKDSVKAGDQITIMLIPAKNGNPVGFLLKLVLANGKQLSGNIEAN